MPITDDPPAPARPAAAAPPPPHAGLAGAVRVVFSVTLLSRLGGLARDLMLTYVFGATAVGSAFSAGFTVPNMFRRLFGEGALSAAFLPEYTQTHKTDPHAADRFASVTVLALLALTTALTALIEAVLAGVLILMPHSADRALSIQLIMLMLPFMPLVCVAAILGGMLQVHGRFGPASSGPILLNTFILVAGAGFLAAGPAAAVPAAYVLGAATVASGLSQCLWYLRLLRPHVRWTRAFEGTGSRVRLMLRRFVPVLIGLGTLQLNAFMDTLIAMWPIWFGPTIGGAPCPLDERSNAILSYTQRLYQFPLGVFGIAVATAVFPMLSRHADEPGHFGATLRRGLRMSLFIGAPASVGLLLVRDDLVRTLFWFAHGFGAAELDRASAVLAGFAVAVWAYSLNQVFTRAFYAMGRTRTPMNVSLAMVGLNIALNFTLIWRLREAGLAWATAGTAVLQCIVLGLLARGMIGGRSGELVRSLAVIAAASLGMAGAVVGVQLILGPRAGWTAHGTALLFACVTGIGVYGAVSWALRSHELGWLMPAARRVSP